ncbi:MAG: type II toxin-antitoxin system RelE/ParE family toxin [Deltaproteobacteria bacterium]|nr:type II toxin-antitoxin system RelE/ParE family toxin [Deltaproteobacteria bacterium]
MTTLIWSPAARDDVVRLRKFIESHNPDKAKQAAESLKQAASLLINHPGLGKRLEGRQDRELFIPSGKRGYVMRYRLDGQTIIILRIWHSLEHRTPADDDG